MYIQAGRGQTINGSVAELADEYGVTMAPIAPACLLDQGGVDAPIVGTTGVEHLEDAVAAVGLDPDDSDVAWLEEPYEPLPVAGYA